MIFSQNKDDESSLNQKKQNLNINNSSNNNNNIHSSSSLYINYISPINKNINNKNKSKKELINNESMKNKMILTSVDNSSVIGSKEKILSYNQNNNQIKNNIQYQHKKQENINNIILNAGGVVGGKKNSKNKKYPLTSLNSRKNSVEKKKSNKSLLQKYQQYYNKNSNRNKIFQSTNVNTCSNKNLMTNNKAIIGFSCFNNYIKNSKIQKNINKQNKINSQNISHFLFNNKKYPNKSIINNIKNSANTAKVSPRTSFINNNSKSLKAINNKNVKEENKDFIHVIKNKSKINEIIKNINIGKSNNKNNSNIMNKNKNASKNKSKNNTNYNSFNNFYNNFLLNNNGGVNNVNNNSNICYNNFENILNNCQTTSGAFYNNYNININNQINNHIIYNNSNSRKKLNNMNFINNKINKIISQSQQEILQFKKNTKKHFTSNNSPNKIFNYKIVSNQKLKSNNNNMLKNNNIFFLFKNLNKEFSHKNSKNKSKNKNNNIKKTKKYKGFRNHEKNRKNSKIKSKSTEKLNMQFQMKSLKNELIINENNNNNNNTNNISKINNNNKIKSCGKLEMYNKENDFNQTNNAETIKKNIYMEDSKKLINYIKEFYKQNKEYPNTNLDFYKYGRLIGQGAFGKVNLGLNVLTGRVVAIKSFNKKNLNSPNNENMKKIIYETNLMRKLNHPNITKILEMFEDDKYILIIMEYINGGNLFSFVKKRRKLTEKISKFLFKQIILGIKNIHSKNIVHRDIKLENILIDLNNTIKICDFGIGRILSSPDELLHDQCGTPMYMAPEILLCSKDKGYLGFPVDIWSAGIALYIMLSGTLPFSVKNENDSFVEGNNNKKKNIALKKAIINNNPKKIEKISDKARDLLHGLLNKDPSKRLTCDEILNHPWLNDEEIANSNNKHHLFTKAEMKMLSKTYIDYRKANMDELQENFTISNLKRDKDINNNDKNVSTKSFILTPYNSLFADDDDSMEEIEKYNDSEFDDFNNKNIFLENELISFGNKVKEFNMLYELNNNNEVDNGMLINTKINTLSSWTLNDNIINNSVIKTESVLCVEDVGNDVYDYDENNNGYSRKVVIQNKQIKNKENKDENKENRILNKIELLGYDKNYVKKCLESNLLCQATCIYFLLMNYDNI